MNFDWDPVKAAQDEERRLKWEEEQAARDKAEKAAFRASLWESSGVPTRHRAFSLPAEASPWLDAYRRLDGALGSGFLYVAMGNRGTGKTQLGTCLVRAACASGRRARYVKALDIFIALREVYRQEGGSEAKVIDQFVQPDLLVIDAMEERGETAFENRLLNHIIDKRYDNCDDTLIITNQTVDAFAESVGPSIVSRIHETGDKIVCDWESFRRKSP